MVLMPGLSPYQSTRLSRYNAVPELGSGYAATRVHYAARRRGGVAARGAGAAAERMRRIGVLMTAVADDPESQARLAAFVQGLQQLGWTDRPQRADRLSLGRRPIPIAIRRYAAELVALAPDVILAAGSAAMAALQQATRTVPIVFVTVLDPVGAGLVDSLARPGGNVTGFCCTNTV